jgi:hypothetical protein
MSEIRELSRGRIWEPAAGRVKTAARLPSWGKTGEKSVRFGKKAEVGSDFCELRGNLGVEGAGIRPVFSGVWLWELTILLNVLIFCARWCRC